MTDDPNAKPRVHQELWDLNSDLIERCVDHPFVRGLGDGSLPRDAFRRYIAQDAFFLDAFVKAYALALAKTETTDHAKALHGFIGGVLDELKMHAGYADSLGIDLSHVQPYRETLGYTEFLQSCAWHGQLSEILAAMVPCMTLYQHLGKTLLPMLCDDHPYRDWIISYSGDGFSQLCRDLEDLFNDVASNTALVRQAYRYAMTCEHDFFTAPLKG
ncbi:TenA family protein [Crateriforma conspicua]|uniref:Thiaminase-2 n=1 Tax=Crateriforma conspicua TaxID=2527996 RepID=A0A5C6FIY6_9PLAN|nr:TenA family protein [Crateriforma conspicua]TWU62205.1 Thiaminase-2 [Crateriforma conspicua]